jgi:hypothetical protein
MKWQIGSADHNVVMASVVVEVTLYEIEYVH